MKVHPLKQLCADSGLEVTFSPINNRMDKGQWAPDAQHYLAILKYQGRQTSAEYSIGSGVDKPRVADLIHSLLLEASSGRESFEDFCSSFGLDTDSRKAHATWLACQTTARDIKFLLGEDLSVFEEAAQDY